MSQLPTAPPMSFVDCVKNKLDRDYVLLIDKSGSMNWDDISTENGYPCTRWKNAENAVKVILESIMEFDEDGIDIYLFSSNFTKIENVTSYKTICDIFKNNTPSGGTYMGPPLHDAIRCAKNKEKKTSILIMTDGEASDKEHLQNVIKDASFSVGCADEICITFIRIGDDTKAKRFLEALDEAVGLPFDIVCSIEDDKIQTLNPETVIDTNMGIK